MIDMAEEGDKGWAGATANALARLLPAPTSVVTKEESMGISERYAQQQWDSAILNERMTKAKSLHAELKSYAWDDLSDRDRIIMDVLGWITLENDNVPELDLQED